MLIDTFRGAKQPKSMPLATKTMLLTTKSILFATRYLAPGAEFKKAKIGEKMALRIAGPIY